MKHANRTKQASRTVYLVEAFMEGRWQAIFNSTDKKTAQGFKREVGNRPKTRICPMEMRK